MTELRTGPPEPAADAPDVQSAPCGADARSDCGAIRPFSSPPGLPIVVVPQLWCFRDLDPTGKWIEQRTLTLERDSGRLTERATSSGPRPDDVLLAHFADAGWARVIRVPIVPPIGLRLVTPPEDDGRRGV